MKKNNRMIEKMIKKFGSGKGLLAYLAITLLLSLALIIGLVKIYNLALISTVDRNGAFDMLRDSRQKLESKNIELYEDRLEKAFTEPQLVAMTKQFVQYELYVNNRKIGKNETIFYSQTPQVVITFYESFNRDALKLFPFSTLKKHSKVLKEELEKEISVGVTKSEYVFESLDTTEGIRTDLVFSGVQAGEIITLDLNYEFSNLLGLSDSSIEIFYNVTSGGN